MLVLRRTVSTTKHYVQIIQLLIWMAIILRGRSLQASRLTTFLEKRDPTRQMFWKEGPHKSYSPTDLNWVGEPDQQAAVCSNHTLAAAGVLALPSLGRERP